MTSIFAIVDPAKKRGVSTGFPRHLFCFPCSKKTGVEKDSLVLLFVTTIGRLCIVIAWSCGLAELKINVTGLIFSASHFLSVRNVKYHHSEQPEFLFI
jgi:hypothetical protein